VGAIKRQWSIQTSRGDDAALFAANCNWFAAQFRIRGLLNRCEESIGVKVDY
jgi:hypothetical protein